MGEAITIIKIEILKQELAEWGYTMIVVDVIYKTHDGELYEDKSEWHQFKDNKLIRI